MGKTDNYIEINRNGWNQRVEHHLQSDFYDVAGFKQGNTSLKPIELALLGDVAGKSILHLQCHFGQDSLSLARIGAKVTGVDFSDTAINTAKSLNTELGLDAEFICTDVYSLPEIHTQQYDIVFTTYGTIGWLPDMNKWASVIATHLKPGGQLVFVEFHPAVWMFDDNFSHIAYSYFNTETIVEESEGTYTNRDAPIKSTYVSWNHPMSEVLNALIGQGLTITTVNEYDYSPYNCFAGMEEYEPGKFRLKAMGNKLPMVYAVTAIK